MLYRIVKLIAYLFFHSYVRLDITGHGNVPRSGGVLLAPNHISYLDPIIVGTAVKREVYSMAKEELFKSPLSRHVMSSLKAFPVGRGRIDRVALKSSLQILAGGHVLCVFPEGTIPQDDKIIEAKQGVAWLVLKTRVPVVPVKIIGSNKLLPDGMLFPRMGRARIIFGRPISFDFKGDRKKENKKIITNRIMEEVEKLG